MDVDRMEDIVQYYVGNKEFMGAVLVARNGEILLDKGYGYANLEWQIPNSPDGKFRLGSITKQFTAASILLLQERGKLKIDDRVKKYMPDAPAAWDKVTIYNLLTHTSGIPSLTDFPEYHSQKVKAAAPADLVAIVRDKPLDFEPDSQSKYSNSGYQVLGYLVEKISGESHRKFLQDNIFTPLAMKESGCNSYKPILARRVSGYSPGPDGWVNAEFIDMTVPFAAGDIYSTTHDLLTWKEALFGGKLLSAESLKTMTTPYKDDYGCGLGIGLTHGHKRIGHGGGIEGFNTALDYFPDDRLVIAVLGNLNGGAPYAITAALGSVALGETVVLPSERKAAKIDPTVFDALVGRYELSPGFVLTFTREGDRFFSQGTGQPKLEIFPESKHAYFAKAVDAQITFVVDAQGLPTGIVLHQNGQDIPGKRLAGGA